MNNKQLTFDEYKQQLSPKEKQEIINKARKKTENSQLMMVGGGLASYGLGVVTQPIFKKQIEKLYNNAVDQHIDHTVNLLNIQKQQEGIHKQIQDLKEKHLKEGNAATVRDTINKLKEDYDKLGKKREILQSNYAKEMEKQLKRENLKLQFFSALPSTLKAGGKLVGALGLAEYLANKISQKVDKTGQGIYDDDYLEGKKKNYLLGVGGALVGLGFLGRANILDKGFKAALKTKKPSEIIESLKKGQPGELFKQDFKEGVLGAKDAIDDIRHVKNSDEYVKAKEELLQHGKTLKDLGVAAGFNDKTLSRFGLSEGLIGAGGYLFTKGLSQHKNQDPYSSELQERYNEYKNNLTKHSSTIDVAGLKKEASIETAVALHALQNLIGAGLTKTDLLNKKVLAPFAVKAMSEGYHGKSHTGKIGSLIKGPLNQVMPEMKGIQKKMRHVGKTLQEEGVDIHNLSSDDLKALDALAQGNLKDALKYSGDSKITKTLIKSILPIDDAAIVAGAYEGSQKLNDEALAEIEKIYKKTNAHRTLKNIANYIKEQGDNAFTQPKGASLKESEFLNDTIANNIAHVGLALHDPITAGFNATKRLLVADELKPIKIEKKFKSKTLNKIRDKLNRVSETTTKGVNATKKGIEFLFTKAPSGMAYDKGMINAQDISKAKQLLNFAVINPINEAIRSDSYKFGQMGRISYERAGAKDAEVLKGLKNKQEKARAFIDKIDGKGVISGTGKLLKATWNAVRTTDDSKFNRDDIVNIARLYSKNPEKRLQAEEYFTNRAREAIVKNQDEIKEKLKNNMYKVVEEQQKINEEAANIENKFDRWRAPGAAIGLGVASIPAVKAIYDRNQQYDQKQTRH